MAYYFIQRNDPNIDSIFHVSDGYSNKKLFFCRKVEGAIAYGTAGFRTKAELLDHVMYRMGLLATLRYCNVHILAPVIS